MYCIYYKVMDLLLRLRRLCEDEVSHCVNLSNNNFFLKFFFLYPNKLEEKDELNAKKILLFQLYLVLRQFRHTNQD